MRPPWLTARGWLVAMIPFAFTIGMLAGCPKPGPTPNGPPDASDAAPPAPPPPCDQVCVHVHDELHCMAGDCLRICERIQRAEFRSCAAAARSCSAVTDCGRPRR